MKLLNVLGIGVMLVSFYVAYMVAESQSVLIRAEIPEVGVTTDIDTEVVTTAVPAVHEEKLFEPFDVLFVGDIMLGRTVETFMDTGTNTPFAYVGEFVSEPAITVGNFEGVVSEVHEHAESMTFRFSIKDEYLYELRKQGFDVLSLANNHSLDYGTTSLAYTRALCDTYGLVCGGSPRNREGFTTSVVEEGDVRIGFLFLHTLYGGISTTSIKETLMELGTTSDIQIAYVHWGDEYVLTHNALQQELAHVLIDDGVDLVVGHHPHVVQDIEMYNGKLIFYSLGNFIFDQYFDTDVQEMIALRMSVRDTEYVYSVHPLTTVNSQMQPQAMNDKRSKALLERIFSIIQDTEGVNPLLGTISVPR